MLLSVDSCRESGLLCKVSKYFKLMIASSMPGFLEVYGYYDQDTQSWSIDPTVQQLISSLMTIGTFVSSLLVGPVSSKVGRKVGLWAASLLNFVATAIMLGTTSLGALYFARLLLGEHTSPPVWETLLRFYARHIGRLVSDVLPALRPRSCACTLERHRFRCVSMPTIHRIHYRGGRRLRDKRH